jgi:hypothetical protein
MTSVLDICIWCEIDGVACGKCWNEWIESLEGWD